MQVKINLIRETPPAHNLIPSLSVITYCYVLPLMPETVTTADQTQINHKQQYDRSNYDRIRGPQRNIRHPEKTVTKGINHIQYRVKM